jgi:hypothetical protein
MVALFTLMLNDLLAKIHHQKSQILICGERPLSYQSDLKIPSELCFDNDGFRSIPAILAAGKSDNLVAKSAQLR